MNNEINRLPLLLYDHECTFCKRFADAISHLDKEKKINLQTIHNKKIYDFFPEINEHECHDIVHLIDEHMNIYKGPEVIQYLVKFFPNVSRFAWLLETNVGKKALDFFYQGLNHYRKSVLNKCPSCKDKF